MENIKKVSPDTLEGMIKSWSIDSILWHHCSQWFWFMTDKITEEKLLIDREICEKEIQRRLSEK